MEPSAIEDPIVDGPPSTRLRKHGAVPIAANKEDEAPVSRSRREDRQQQQAKEIANAIRHAAWTVLCWIVGTILSWTPASSWSATDPSTQLPMWYVKWIEHWNARYKYHWQRWKGVVTFFVILLVTFALWSPLKQFILSGYLPKSAHAPVVTYARAISNPETFVNGYMTYVPFGALLDAYAAMDERTLIQRIQTLTDRHAERINGKADPGMRDLDDNNVDDDLELQALRKALDTVGASLAHHVDTPPEIAIAMGPVCGYVTQSEEGQFHVRRLCWDLLNVMLDTTYYPQGIVNRIMNANYKNNPALDKTVKERMELVNRNKELPNTKKNILQGMPPCVCLHHLGFVESGAYTVMPNGRSKLFLNPRIAAMTKEDREHNQRHAFVNEMRPPHEEIEMVDRAFWSILGESPRLKQNAWLKMSYWTLPDDYDLECFYGRDLGTPEKALLFAEAYITQEMRNYENNNHSSSSRQENRHLDYLEWLNGLSHAYYQHDRKAMMTYAYEKAVELRLDMKFIQQAHEREQNAREKHDVSTDAVAATQGWLEKALRGAGIPTGGFGRGAGGDDQKECTADSRRQEPRLVYVESERVEAPQSQCNLHCIHLHNTFERRRANVFKTALEQHRQMNEQRHQSDRARITEEHVAVERRAEEDVDDYENEMF